MTDKQIAARILLTGIVLALGALPLLTSCATHELVVAAGSSVCLSSDGRAPTNGECERLLRIGQTLNEGPLASAIEEARK